MSGDTLAVESVLRSVRAVQLAPLSLGLHSLALSEVPKVKPQPPLSFDPQCLDRLRSRIEEALGNRFSFHQQAYQKAIAARDTIFVPHHLIKIHHRLGLSKDMLKLDRPEADLVRWSECQRFFELLDRARTEAWWSKVEHELREPGSFVHLYLLLLWYFEEKAAGRAVEVVPAPATYRTADLVLLTSECDRVPVEIKTPEKLRNPELVLDKTSAQKIVKKAYKKAASGANRQIGTCPSLLCIGGLYLNQANQELLVAAAEQLLLREKPRSIAGIVIMTLQLTVDRPVLSLDGNIGVVPGNTCCRPGLCSRVAVNPHYIGALPVVLQLHQHHDRGREMREYTTPK